jgi:tRNA uridine 5-carboxymethylaminomethyl modification enzyme
LESVREYVRSRHISVEKDKIAEFPDSIRQAVEKNKHLAKLVKMPEIHLRDFIPILERDGVRCPVHLLDQLENDLKYEGYIRLQKEDQTRMNKMQDQKIPESFKFEEIPSLSREMKERLVRHRPTTMAAAEHVPGMTPAALSILAIYLKLHEKRSKG